jgi:tRNA-specific adenosine deaminase 1
MTLAAEHEAGRRREAARLQGLINKAKAYGARAIVNAVTSDTAVRSAIDKVVADVEKEVYNDPDAVKQGPDLILRSSSAPKARQAIRGAVADGVLEASEKAVGRSSGRWKRLAKVFIRKAIPMIPFGFIDNFLMILAGDMIDATLATTLGISTMAAAGLGNAGSDAVGAMSQDRVEKWMKKIGLGDVETEGGKAEAIAGLAGGAFGVAVGALIGMFPLLFGSDDEENRRGRHMTADSADVIKRIEKTIRNDALADRMIEDVMGYPQTDLDKRDQHLLYRPVEFGEVEQMSKKRKLDIDWTDHAEYRSELRDVDPRRVNDAIVKILRERLRKQKTRGTERVKVPGGTAVVDYDVSKKPGEADVVTVWASVADRIAADEMRLASARKQFNLKATYDKFNRQYFNNELPRITLKWGRSKRWGGLASGRRGPSGDILPVKITISDFLSMDEERFLGIMLHEMIHIWQWVNGHADHHGAFFKAKRQELSGKAPFTIPVSEDITGMQVSDEVATKAMVVIFMEFASGKDGFLIYTAQMYQRLRTKLQAYFERYINMGTMTKVVFVETTDKKFMKFTHSRQVPRRLRYYPVKSGEMQDALSGGKRLETMKRDKEDVAAQRQLKEEVPQKGRRLMDGLASLAATTSFSGLRPPTRVVSFSSPRLTSGATASWWSVRPSRRSIRRPKPWPMSLTEPGWSGWLQWSQFPGVIRWGVS